MSNDLCNEMQDKKSTLSLRQRKAVAVLLKISNIEKAAKELKLNPCTLHRWLRLPHFKAAIDTARAETVQRAKHLIETASEAAVAVLIRIMQGPNDSAKFRAAALILEYSLTHKELTDLTDRAKQLETMFKKYQEERL